jgi:signal transduction histidine kinase
LELLSTIGQYLAVALSKEAINLKLRAAQTELSEHANALEKEVNDRTLKLRDTITELETFSHTIAHDLRAPIRAMTGFCEVLSEDFSAVLPAEGAEVIGRLSGACRRLEDLTRDLLAFSKVSRQDIQLAPVDVDEIVSEVLSMNLAALNTVQVRRPLAPVIAHRTLLKQCLANLIDNASKFVMLGAIPEISIYTEEVHPDTESIAKSAGAPFMRADGRDKTIFPSSGGRRIRIVVQDKGIGIDPEAHGKIFGIFERATSSAEYPGSGIGLAIVARAMQRMAGTCEVESALGVGSCFRLELPAAPLRAP